MAEHQEEIGFNPTTKTFASMPQVEVPPGTETLRFVRQGKHPGWTFFSIAIWPGRTKPTPPPQPGQVCAPFNTPSPQIKDHHIVVVDTNPGGGETIYSYMIWVTPANSTQHYSSDPEIINKGG
jgi:hypothetical protein